MHATAKQAARQLSESYGNRARASMTRKQGTVSESLGGSGFGLTSAARQREAYSMFRLWVYCSVHAIAKRVASQQIMAAEQEGEPEDDRAAHVVQRLKSLRQHLPDQLRHAVDFSTLEVLETHPILDHLSHPNPVQKKFEFIYMAVVNLLITGECYWLGGEVSNGQFETWALPTPWFTAKHEGGLFSRYDVQLGKDKLENVDPSLVARTYLPDPADPKGAFSPLRAILQPVRVDGALVQSQEDMFERGINPNLLITVAQQRGPDGKPTGKRPRLQGHQRRQIVRAVRAIWNESVSAGEPAIIDDLIESVHKLHNTPREMDWVQSAGQLKERIMQTYSVNPINLGQIEGVNRAQAVEAERSMCNNAVNPVSKALSETLTDFYRPKVQDPPRLVLWIDPCEVRDPELELRRWTEARKNDDVSKDEYRTNVLGIAPDERPSRGRLLTLVGGLNGAVQTLVQLGQGLISRDAAIANFMTFFEIDESTAQAMVGEAVAAPPPQDQPESTPAAPTEDELEEQRPTEEEDATTALLSAAMKARELTASLPGRATRSTVISLLEKQATTTEEEVGRTATRHFREVRGRDDA